MPKSSKDKRDIYYRQGKSEGYRARSAYKLLHLNEQYGFLGGSASYAMDPASCSSTTRTPQRVVDLCAAPGSWSQVLSRRLSQVPGSHLVAVDLQAMAPLPGVTQIIGDITTPSTAAAVSAALGDSKAQLIVCDGAPDVTGLHDLDEYLQSQLLLAATQITFRLLETGGTFVAKIFTQQPQSRAARHNDLSAARPGTSGALLASQLRTCFDRVEIAKPRSSRYGSVEHFVVCQGFRPAAGLHSQDIKAETDEGARAKLVKLVQDMNQQMANAIGYLPSPQHPAPSDPLLQRVIPFVARGDLSGFDQASL